MRIFVCAAFLILARQASGARVSHSYVTDALAEDSAATSTRSAKAAAADISDLTNSSKSIASGPVLANGSTKGSPDNLLLEHVQGAAMEKGLDLIAQPLKHALSNAHHGHHGHLTPKFGLGGIASAGIGLAIKGVVSLVQDGMAYSSCSRTWQGFMRDYPQLVEHFVEAMRPSAHKFRGGSWKSSRSWTEAAQSLQRTVSFLSSPNMVQHDGKRVLDLDKEYAMLKWCGNPVGSGMYSFISTLAFEYAHFYYYQLMDPDWWTESEPIWGPFRRKAMWHVYTGAWGYDFRTVDSLAWRRGGSYRLEPNIAKGRDTHEFTRIDIAPFVDTLPLEHFRRDGHAAYPPNVKNEDTLARYYKPYLLEAISSRQLVLAQKSQYGHALNETGARTMPIVLANFDTFWSIPDPKDQADAVQFVVVAADPLPTKGSSRAGGVVASNVEVHCSHYVDWNGDLVAF